MKSEFVERIEGLAEKVIEDLDSVMVPPRIRVFDEPELLPERNDFTMSSGIARTPQGRLWVSWFGGEDGERAFMMMASSDDDGNTWSPPRYIIKEPLSPNGFHRSILGGNLWTDPTGRLWCFFSYCIGFFDGRSGAWCSVCENPDDEELVWSTPRRLWHGFTLNKPIIMSNGEWLLPTALWQRYFIRVTNEVIGCTEICRELDEYRMTNFLVSGDQGKTWERRGGTLLEDRLFDEPSLIETSPGQLRCLLRSHFGLSESYSSDFGRTWTFPTPSFLKHCSARIFTARLASGRVLLVKHGPLYEATGRTLLTAYLSDDDGESWYGGLCLDERDNVSYPDGFQAADGKIYVAYDRKRIDGEILLAVFTEEDIKAGKPVSDAARLKIPVQRTEALAGK